MRFLMLSTFYPPYSFGGDASYLHRLTNELAARGHEVDVVHCADAYRMLERGAPPTGVQNHPNVTVHTLRSRLGPLSPLITQQTGRSGLKARAIRELIEARRFDVIHYHNMSLIGLDTLTMGKAVKLYTTHEHWLVCPMHVLWRNGREACTRRTCFSCQLVSRRPPQWWRAGGLLARTTRSIDRFLCPSRFTLRKHQELGFSGPVTHLPYFLPEQGPPSSRASPHPRDYVLFVGRLEKLKGAQHLIEAFRTYRDTDLVIVGTGAYGRELRALARDLPHVRFLGRLPYEEIRHWYQHALALAVPSICFEVFGIVILEAFAVSTPALVTPFGALPEVIGDSGGGFVFQSQAELVEQIEQLRRDRALRDELGRQGHDAYRRWWTEEPHLQRYLGVIDEVLGSQ